MSPVAGFLSLLSIQPLMWTPSEAYKLGTSLSEARVLTTIYATESSKPADQLRK